MERQKMAVDINRMAASALQAYLENERDKGHLRERRGNRRLGGVGAVALGVGLAVAARAVYNRARSFDLERVAGAVEEKLRD
jgi:hypothetical protein